MKPEDVYRLFDLPWELNEMIARYLAKMLIIWNLEKNLKFPKLYSYRPISGSWGEFTGGEYFFTTGYHNYDIWIIRNGEHVRIKRSYFMLK